MLALVLLSMLLEEGRRVALLGERLLLDEPADAVDVLQRVLIEAVEHEIRDGLDRDHDEADRWGGSDLDIVHDVGHRELAAGQVDRHGLACEGDLDLVLGDELQIHPTARLSLEHLDLVCLEVDCDGHALGSADLHEQWALQGRSGELQACGHVALLVVRLGFFSLYEM